MKNFNDLTITDIKWNSRSIAIRWYSPKSFTEGESCLYQHSDGTWAIDPVSRSYGSSFGERLLSQVMMEFVRKAFPYDDASSFASSDVVKVEGLLKKDRMYRKALKKPSSTVITSRPPAQVWYAEGVQPPEY